MVFTTSQGNLWLYTASIPYYLRLDHLLWSNFRMQSQTLGSCLPWRFELCEGPVIQYYPKSLRSGLFLSDNITQDKENKPWNDKVCSATHPNYGALSNGRIWSTAHTSYLFDLSVFYQSWQLNCALPVQLLVIIIIIVLLIIILTIIIDYYYYYK